MTRKNRRHYSYLITMEILHCHVSCSFSALKHPFPRRHNSPVRFPVNTTRFPRRPTSELQTSVSVPAENGTAFSPSPSVPSHKVTVHDRQRDVVHEFFVPEDQYILHTAEAQNITLPFACRHGCCTSCAVRVKSGQLRQPEALGISAELRSQGYALLCVGYPSSDLEVETQDEDEVYWLQFGRYFARGPVERDDYALELAMGDE
ncbi:OLC1v1031351C2 [Oldenlandia corymbosa var. corymbosa]|uniref:OLC1v1031351C2 n=2 Tax=Oldenlandia corymbosa var. corymbosa TaxID=529605 RepID=A0AAV1CJW4_OLDCO|nr:OLC1v1031351C2 [Oldenlandia corymbosa var. corymbosa]